MRIVVIIKLHFPKQFSKMKEPERINIARTLCDLCQEKSRASNLTV